MWIGRGVVWFCNSKIVAKCGLKRGLTMRCLRCLLWFGFATIFELQMQLFFSCKMDLAMSVWFCNYFLVAKQFATCQKRRLV
jgi:hypothetical protein